MAPEVSAQARPGPLILRIDELVPTWDTLHATEAPYLRWLVTYVGGPEGYLNANPETGVTSDRALLGLMRLYAGNRQYGVHTHTITEIYVIVSGRVESIEAGGERQVAGPMDCLYIPPGAPHAVRAVGQEDVVLIWAHDQLEPLGSSVYVDESELGSSADYPRVDLVRWDDLEPRWTGKRATEGGHLRWDVSWVRGVNDPGHNGVVSTRIALGATVLTRGNADVEHAQPVTRTCVVVGGRAKVIGHPEIPSLGPLDAIVLEPGTAEVLRAVGDEDLRVIWFNDRLP
jgi:mannose-6-phosphate isomerase-like protein (cupin superfamily)